MNTPPSAEQETVPDAFLPSAARRIPPAVYVAAALIAIGTAAFHVHSYWWSESLTLCDVMLRAEEGLVSLNVPLVRLAAKETPCSGFSICERSANGWKSGGEAGHARLRYWMASLDQVRCEGVMFADFGYWKGAWQSDARPGPFVVMFVPVWFVGLAALVGFPAVYFRVIRFRLHTLLIAMTLTAGVAYLLMLRADV